jgi:D-aminoacyl-tRNA deacylase
MVIAAHPHHIEELTHPVPLSINWDLVLEAQKSDQRFDDKNNHNSFLDAIYHIPCIHFSGNGIAVLNTFIVDQSSIAQRTDELIQACVRTIYTAHNCTYENGILTIRKQRFNPAKARSLGIFPGPEYGNLISGQSIVQDGYEIHPDMVMDAEEYTIVVSSDTHMEKSHNMRL